MKSRELKRNLKIAATAVLVPSGLLCGLVGYVAHANAHLPPSPESLVFRDQEDHPVTAAMAVSTRELAGKAAPDFSGRDLAGVPCSLGSLTKGKPLVLFFVELQCPCCKGAKPYIDRIKDYYGDVCNVVGVIDAKPEMAKLWSQATAPEFDVLPDPDMSIVRAYKADRGTYTTLIAPGGRIVKAYPGYCQDMLRDISAKISKMAGIKTRPMPLAPAPTRMTSGCIFPGTKLPEDQL